MPATTPINLPIIVQATPKKLTLPEYETLEKIVILTKKLELTRIELEKSKEQLRDNILKYKKKLQQDEAEITTNLESKLKRKFLTDEISRIRKAEQDLKHSINRKINSIISDSSNDKNTINKIQTKILANLAKKNNLN